MIIQGGLISIFFSLDHQIETFDAEEKDTKYRCVIFMGICVILLAEVCSWCKILSL